MRSSWWWDLGLILMVALVVALAGAMVFGMLFAAPPAPAQAERVITATVVRRQMEDQAAQIDAMLAAERQLLSDLQAIAPLVPTQYRRLVVDVARANGLDPHDLAALGWVETRWDCTRRGAAGEVGCMQILPSTAAWVASEMGVATYDLNDPAWNVAMAAFYLRHLVDQQGSVDAALAAYNGGPAWQERAPRTARGYADRVRAAKQLLIVPGGGGDRH